MPGLRTDYALTKWLLFSGGVNLAFFNTDFEINRTVKVNGTSDFTQSSTEKNKYSNHFISTFFGLKVAF
jgi:hypothetical protein